MNKIAPASIAITLLVGIALSQSNTTLPAFEAADVHTRPASANPPPTGASLRDGRYLFQNATMVDLVATAYGVAPDKVLGGPSWLEWDRYDIIAKTSDSTKEDTANLMLRTLLADRFKLSVHNEDRPFPIYGLSIGRGGPKLKEAAGTGQSGCEIQQPQSGSNQVGILCRGMAMSEFAEVIHRYVDKPVVDLTGLQGFWDITLKWTPRAQLAAAGGDGISIFDAVDRQLGLKLDPQNRPLPVLVVDFVNQKPTDNLPDVIQKIPAVVAEFEVADIKPSAPGVTRPRGRLQPGRVGLQGSTLKNLINTAWDIPEDLVVGPKLIDSDRFDIVAQAPAAVFRSSVDLDMLRSMLRKLLVERFKITYHNEDQLASVYALIAPKRETKLKKADPRSRTGCKRTTGSPNGGIATLSESVTCQNITLAQLAERLPVFGGSYVNHPAIDLTGIEGAWDLTLSWTPQAVFAAPPRPGDATQAPGAAPSVIDPNGGLTFFEAIERQLGLKLELQKHSMPVFVVDRAERPSEH